MRLTPWPNSASNSTGPLWQRRGASAPAPRSPAATTKTWAPSVTSTPATLPGLLRDLTGITELPATGLPLGLFSHATCEAPLVALPPGAALLLVSKGLLEGKRRREEFGLERVKTGLQQAANESARDLCATVIDDVQQFMRKPPIHNDVTALALVRTARQIV